MPSRPPHPPKVEIIENQSFQDQNTNSESSSLEDLNGNCARSLPIISLPCSLPFQDHLLSKNIVLTLETLFPGRSECAGSSPLSPMNNLFKTIFQVKLLYRVKELCLMGNLSSECAEHSISSDTNKWPFLDYLLNKTITLTCQILSHRRSEQ